MRALAIVLVAILAGCADDPPPVQAGEAVLTEGPDFPMTPPAPMTWQRLAETQTVLTPATRAELGVSIPPGALQVLVNLTLETGAGYAFTVTMGACAWRREVAAFGLGTTLAADCGGLDAGEEQLALSIDAGAIRGLLTVEALLCDARAGACPTPGPPGR